MKKISLISLICAIILLIGSITLIALGFTYIDGTQIIRSVGAYMRISYYSTSLNSMSLAMIITGGFLLVSSVLLFMLSALTCCKKKPCKCAPEPHPAPATFGPGPQPTSGPAPAPEPQPTQPSNQMN